MLQHRFRPAALKLRDMMRDGAARQDRELLDRDPAVAAAELLRRRGPRH
jgi:hypothetical protein